MVTVYLKEHAPVAVKGAVRIEKADFWVRLIASDYDTLAEFRAGDVIGYAIEAENDPQAD